ncbi:hypothetical protein E4T42_03018 [Aureobasidium subglaciale]|uniref:Tim44-like domain-containing protein n=1 Tax=Aureobasidium subglaciale (strain EXF-2481) TaxID=1043005 RepID=A0A074YC90_AURSE|nr:uncharacterized protein AUEXF2481DRAFT_39970 [Aureobasidium subglaciale EXF-2481]KAI5204891.1 hypothetical protein E4T38_04472 [Aureobasidium subglaciale]KAI5223910.1 hypothetical protein E4T40_04248 [Aureobasidium subglaciale]KAI5227469.1 hypothetical protein E4T41_04330 [Aureobasidium subglaciale]KAI5253076.1 hypothetical protein E4T42_03018 [Aureobasidium subglaciale]KAI5262754.1 hypothetical protein E4T46_04216 [Aureobasidium subglaciale]
MSTRTPVQRLLLQHNGTTPLTALLAPYLRQSCLRHQPARLFSNTNTCNAGVRKKKSFAPRETSLKQPSQKSFEVMKKEQMKNIDQMPNDVGLIPGTFIMPTGNQLPSLTQDFKTRYALEKHRIWLRMKEIFGRHYMGYMHVKPRADFQTSKIPSISKDLYTEMYTSFSQGNLAPIMPKLCENIAQSLEARIHARGPNTGMMWSLHQWLAEPKVVSHKYMPMSLEDNKDKTQQTTIQQVVVRMQSLQSLKMVKKVKLGGKVVEVMDEQSSQASPKAVTEYLVVQRLCKRGNMGDWMIWGTTTESDPNEALADA